MPPTLASLCSGSSSSAPVVTHAGSDHSTKLSGLIARSTSWPSSSSSSSSVFWPSSRLQESLAGEHGAQTLPWRRWEFGARSGRMEHRDVEECTSEGSWVQRCCSDCSRPKLATVPGSSAKLSRQQPLVIAESGLQMETDSWPCLWCTRECFETSYQFTLTAKCIDVLGFF